jgi:hypothetical protein
MVATGQPYRLTFHNRIFHVGNFNRIHNAMTHLDRVLIACAAMVAAGLALSVVTATTCNATPLEAARADIDAATWLYHDKRRTRLYGVWTLANGTLCGWSAGYHRNGDFAIAPFTHKAGRTTLDDASFDRLCFGK